MALASELVDGASLLDTETPAYLEFGSTRYIAPAGSTAVMVAVIRSGDFRIPASAECVLTDNTFGARQGNDVTTRPILFPAGRSFVELSIPIPNASPSSIEERNLTITLTNPGPRTFILQGSASIHMPPSRLPAPRLNVEHASGRSVLLLTWPGEFSEFVLEKCDDLQAGPWIEVKTPPVIVDGCCRVEESGLVTKQAFYRLRQRLE